MVSEIDTSSEASRVNCPHCATRAHVYDRACLQCCARLVESARPSRNQQESMLAWIDRSGIHTKRAVVDAVRRRAALDLQKPLEAQ